MREYKRLFFVLPVLLSLYTCNASQTNGYKILGTTVGLKDSTLLYLDNTSTSETIDSAFIVNNQFQFTGSLKEKTLQVIIATEDHSNYKFFWLENSTITFKAEKGKFRNALITGSKTQDEENILNTVINPIRNKRDSLLSIYKTDTSAIGKALVVKIYDESDQQEKEKYVAFIKNYPASIISANLLNIYSTAWGKNTVAELYKNFTAENKNTGYGKEIAEFLNWNRDVKVGDKYIDFTQTDPTGKNISVSNFKNKVVLLEFWASWCYWCVVSNPELVKLYEKYNAKGFEIVGVSLDKDKDSWLKAIKKDNLTWSNVSELNGNRNKAALIYGVGSIPDNFLIDKNGVIVAKNITMDSLERKIAELLH